MKSGFAFFPTADSVPPGELARMVEERGHDALFFCEHTHIPASRLSPYPAGGELPAKYAETYDPFVACTAAAAATTQLRVGTGVCLVTERDPILLAKEVASVDVLSGGRFEFGIGAGWNREEMENHGTDPRTRMALMGDRVAAMKAIWTEEEATYEGRFTSFERIWCKPKPVQQPYPPILVGGDGPTVIDRVLAYGDGWFPTYRRELLFDRLAELRERADRDIDVQVMAMPAKPEVLEELAEHGVSRAVYMLPSGERGKLEEKLERWEAAFAEFAPSS